jgi:hypothetical protein
MTIATTAFTRNRSDDIFFPLMALFALGVVVVGFGHPYFFAGMMAAKLPTPLVHVHAAILSAWIAVQAMQPLLVAAGRVDWHQRMGIIGMAIAAAVPVIGGLAVIGSIRRQHGDAVDLAFSLAAAVDFAVLSYLGLRQRRRDLSAHKRLMLLATISILGPAIGRLPFVTGIPIYYATLGGFAAMVLAFDLLALERLHSATILGAAVIAASQTLAELFWHTAAATGLVAWIQHI